MNGQGFLLQVTGPYINVADDMYGELLNNMKASLQKINTFEVLMIACVVFTIFYFKLLWSAPDIDTAFTLDYLCSYDNLCQLALSLGLTLSLYLLVRYWSKR